MIVIDIILIALGGLNYISAVSSNCSGWDCMGYGLIGIGALGIALPITVIILCYCIRTDLCMLQLSSKNKRINNKLRLAIKTRIILSGIILVSIILGILLLFFMKDCAIGEGCHFIQSVFISLILPGTAVLLGVIICLSFYIHHLESKQSTARNSSKPRKNSYSDPYL